MTEDERRQLEDALRLESTDLNNESDEVIIGHRHSCYEEREIPIEDGNCNKSGENYTSVIQYDVRHEEKYSVSIKCPNI